MPEVAVLRPARVAAPATRIVQPLGMPLIVSLTWRAPTRWPLTLGVGPSFLAVALVERRCD